MKNLVIDSGTAIIGGQNTGLAGCNNAECPNECLRKDPMLTCVRKDYKSEGCRLYIPLESPPRL